MIDVHAHAVFEMVMGAAGVHGPELYEVDGQPRFRAGCYELCNVRYRGSVFMEPELRIQAMDAAGIHLQVISPNPLTYFHFIGTGDAVNFCRRHNDQMAAVVEAHSQRLKGFATLPMQDIPAAITELRRAVQELGLLGAYIGTDLNGRSLDDPALDPFYDVCTELDVPLFVHPQPAGIDGPPGDQRLRRFDLDLMLGFAYEETLAIAALIFGGVLHRHPELDVCLTHGGGAGPFMYGRFKRASEMRPWSEPWLKEEGAFQRFYQRLFFDVHVHDEDSLALLVKKAGAGRLVFGTNFGGWDSGASATGGHVDLGHLAAQLDANAMKLLRLDRTG